MTVPPGGQGRVEIRLNRRHPVPVPEGIEELPGDGTYTSAPGESGDEDGIAELPGDDPAIEVPIPEGRNRPERQLPRDRPTEKPIPEEPNRPRRPPR